MKDAYITDKAPNTVRNKTSDKTFYTPNFEGAARAVKDVNMFALTRAILTELGVRRVRDLKSKEEFSTLIAQLGLNVAKDDMYEATETPRT